MSTSVNYLDRFLEPMAASFTPEMARTIVDLRADAQLEGRIALLRNQANRDELSPAEQAEYEDFVEAVDVISIIQAKARRFLAQHNDGLSHNIK
jgi:hypothetical protein